MTDESLFSAALALPLADRAAFLNANCPDPAARRQVEDLLAAADASNPLDRPPPDLDRTNSRATSTASVESTAAVGDRVGPYKLLEKIGEGGMGEVWVADQTEPIKRRVALKLIKPGMDSRSVLGRFEAERQALAVMDHPNIARVLDAGTTPDGRPYFVMELVKGTPITEFADARRLTPKQRLELFVPVCQAIQHAHMKGIIHRDIKPSNVLVALHDETPVPKVIDFGVAKAVGQQLTEKTVYTGFGALVGTPAYMAPEQATFNQLDVDTRADVYALGVLLYELLAGSPPIDKERLRKAALDEVLRLVREEEPPRPSQRLSTAGTRASIAAVRGTEPAKLSALMKGELDWIVMKALEKDRARRYDTATGFAADIQRYLSGEPVQAVPPSVGYRLRKFYRRNKAAVWVATAFLLLTYAGASGIVFARQRAVEAERQSSHARDVLLGRAEAALVGNRLFEVDAALEQLASGGDAVADPRAEAIRRDRDLLRELEDIYEQYWTVCPSHTIRDPEQAKARYPAAFRQYGVAVDRTADEAARRVEQSRVKPALLDHLNTWFFLDSGVAGLHALLDRLDPDAERVRVRKAVAAGNPDALADLAKGVDAGRHPPTFLVMLAVTAGPAVSTPLLEATWSHAPDSFAVALAMCFPGTQSGDDVILGWCRTAVALRPQNALAHYYFGLNIRYNNFGKARVDPQVAVAAFQRATALAPRFAFAHAELGHALQAAGRHTEAVRAYHRALECDPKNYSAHIGLSSDYLVTGEWQRAAAALCDMAAIGDAEFTPEIGCENSFAGGFFGVKLEAHSRQMASELIRGRRYHDLARVALRNPNLPFDDQFERAKNDPRAKTETALGVKRVLPACAAVQTSFGRGVDPPPAADRERFRRAALDWLTKDLDECEAKLCESGEKLGGEVNAMMRILLDEPLLAEVRGPSIRSLPADERPEWEALWRRVVALRDQTREELPPPRSDR